MATRKKAPAKKKSATRKRSGTTKKSPAAKKTKAAAQAKGPPTTRPAITIRQSGAGILQRTRSGVALTFASDEAEAQRAGLSRNQAAALFPKGEKLCLIEWRFHAPPGLPILPERWWVYCIDNGCAESQPDADCVCVLYSSGSDDPKRDPKPRNEGRGPAAVEEGRWYKCVCECTYFG